MDAETTGVKLNFLFYSRDTSSFELSYKLEKLGKATATSVARSPPKLFFLGNSTEAAVCRAQEASDAAAAALACTPPGMSVQYKLGEDRLLRLGHRVRNTCAVCMETFGVSDTRAPWEVTDLKGRRICSQPHPLHLECAFTFLYRAKINQVQNVQCPSCRAPFNLVGCIPSPCDVTLIEKMHVAAQQTLPAEPCQSAAILLMLLATPAVQEGVLGQQILAKLRAGQHAEVNRLSYGLLPVVSRNFRGVYPSLPHLLNHKTVTYSVTLKMVKSEGGVAENAYIGFSLSMSADAIRDILTTDPSSERLSAMLKSCRRCVQSQWTNFVCFNPQTTRVRLQLLFTGETGQSATNMSAAADMLAGFQQSVLENTNECEREPKKKRQRRLRKDDSCEDDVKYNSVWSESVIRFEKLQIKLYVKADMAQLSDGRVCLRFSRMTVCVPVSSGCDGACPLTKMYRLGYRMYERSQN